MSTILRDEPWQDLGFSGRPRGGSLFQKLRPAWKNELEKRAIQEMLSAFTAAYVIAGRMAINDIPSAVAAYTRDLPVVTALGYSSREEAINHLNGTIARYVHTPIADWHKLVFERIDPMSVPDRKLSARLFVGSIRFADNLSSMILLLRRSK